MSSLKTLAESISKYSNIDTVLLAEIIDQFSARSVTKKEYLVKAGEMTKALIFIASGHVRMFNTDKEGNETTMWIGSKGQFITAISSFVFQQPSFWNIAAITDCQVHIIGREKHFELCKQHRDWLDFENVLLSKNLAALEYHMFAQMNLSAEARYRALFKKKSSIFNHVPGKYIASFLGMSPETLSRLRKNE